MLFDKVKGERKLTQIINATVSHEMRNPIHAIKVQVQEMKRINQSLYEIFENIDAINCLEVK